jgi:DNA polymerase-3 subunit delta'
MGNNWGLIGHEWAVDLLRGQLVRGAPRHAYLFTGPRGIGRRTLALRFAQALNAENPPAPGEFDPQSLTSQQIERMQHPDLSVVAREPGDRDLKIEAVRGLGQTLALSPYAAAYRVALLLNFEEANQNAANALLKTLEEPPPRVVLLLTAESAEVLLPTIASRCEALRLRPVPLAALAQGLAEKWGVPEEQARLLAHISGGRPGYAVQLYQNPEQMAQREQWLDEQQEVLQSGRVGRFAYAEKLAKDKEGFRLVLQVWLSYWRDVLLQTAESDAPIANLDRAEELGVLSGRLDRAAAKKTVAAIERTVDLLRANANARLAAEVLLLGMPYL